MYFILIHICFSYSNRTSTSNDKKQRNEKKKYRINKKYPTFFDLKIFFFFPSVPYFIPLLTFLSFFFFTVHLIALPNFFSFFSFAHLFFSIIFLLHFSSEILLGRKKIYGEKKRRKERKEEGRNNLGTLI